MNYKKYKPFPMFEFKERTWTDKVITKAPLWCSVDLRDGNQSIVNPMDLQQKVEFFKLLVKMGFKEIEIGFPAASDTEFLFTRTLIENNLIPDDVTIQVLTQARDHIIKKTFESLDGAKKAIVHFYNSTSTLQRRVVFDKNQKEITEIATDGAKLIMELSEKYGKERFMFEYSPESFTGTEMPYAAEICNAVIDIIKPTSDRKLILNLPSTVELSMPNIYADQIEYMCNNINNRENIIVSLHTHNDRGTGVAASELGILAGADRIEGTLFGNGERTGNADILTLALNMYSQGIDPKLDFGNIDEIINMYVNSTEMPVHPRHPYAGELVFTAFSGSHQDAIKKGMEFMKDDYEFWEVPYLPIDPADFGKSYAPIIRINSQSGKGGLSYILETSYGLNLPKAIQQDFSRIVTEISDKEHIELLPENIYNLFRKYYVNIISPIEVVWYTETHSRDNAEESNIEVDVNINGEKEVLKGTGNGIIDSFARAIQEKMGIEFEIVSYNEHSLEYGTKSKAITYMTISNNGKQYFGAGISTNISKSSIRALSSAINNMIK